MIKPVAEDFQPRRDGLFERRGTWGDVVVGSLLKGTNRTDVYEIIDSSHGAQIEFGHTLWFRMVNRTTGQMHTLKPRWKKEKVTFLTVTPDAEQPVYTPPSDGDKVMLLVEQLGAQVIARKDNESGEIVCPDYAAGQSIGDNRWGVEEIQHLRLCHGMDIGALELLRGNERVKTIASSHAAAHSPRRNTLTGGFPHRHVPENLSYFA